MDQALRKHAAEVRRMLCVRDADTHDAFSRALASVPFRERDAWVDEVLALGEPPDDVADLPQGAVPYVPCGVDAIVHAVREAPVAKGDVFADLGAGLGRVALLAHLLTGTRAIGVELQAHLVERGRRAVAELTLLDDVTLVVGDAADVQLPQANVFFIYASFSPTVQRAVLRALEQRASTQSFVLCAVGFEVRDQSWLSPRVSSNPELMFYDARRGATEGGR